MTVGQRDGIGTAGRRDGVQPAQPCVHARREKKNPLKTFPWKSEQPLLEFHTLLVYYFYVYLFIRLLGPIAGLLYVLPLLGKFTPLWYMHARANTGKTNVTCITPIDATNFGHTIM